MWTPENRPKYNRDRLASRQYPCSPRRTSVPGMGKLAIVPVLPIVVCEGVRPEWQRVVRQCLRVHRSAQCGSAPEVLNPPAKFWPRNPRLAVCTALLGMPFCYGNPAHCVLHIFSIDPRLSGKTRTGSSI